MSSWSIWTRRNCCTLIYITSLELTNYTHFTLMKDFSSKRLFTRLTLTHVYVAPHHWVMSLLWWRTSAKNVNNFLHHFARLPSHHITPHPITSHHSHHTTSHHTTSHHITSHHTTPHHTTSHHRVMSSDEWLQLKESVIRSTISSVYHLSYISIRV